MNFAKEKTVDSCNLIEHLRQKCSLKKEMRAIFATPYTATLFPCNCWWAVGLFLDNHDVGCMEISV